MKRSEAKAEAYVLAAQMIRSNLECGPTFNADPKANALVWQYFWEIVGSLDSRAQRIRIGKRKQQA